MLNKDVIGVVYTNFNNWWLSDISTKILTRQLLTIVLDTLTMNKLYLAYTSDNFENRIIDLHSGRPVFQLSGHTNSIICLLQLTKDILISAGYDKSIKIWKWRTRKCLRTIRAHNNYISELVKHTDTIFFSLANDGIIKKWDIRTYNSLLIINPDQHISLIFKVNESMLCGSVDMGIIFWDIENGNNLITIPFSQGPTFCFANVNEKEIAFTDYMNNIEVWDWVEEYQTKQLKDLHNNVITGLLLVEENVLASCSIDKKVIVWDLVMETVILCFEQHCEGVNGIQMLDEGLIMTYDYKSMLIWDYRTGRIVKRHMDLNKNEAIESISIFK
jgi:WD40 repeat protein